MSTDRISKVLYCFGQCGGCLAVALLAVSAWAAPPLGATTAQRVRTASNKTAHSPNPSAASAAAPINVVLITMDTMRWDRVGSYGAHANSSASLTPALDALAADGILYQRAFSQVPLTWPSHAAILTGMYPFQNGVQDFTGEPLQPKFRNLAEAFHSHGYDTGAVVSSFVLDRSWGLARGFDFYDDAFSGQAFLDRDVALVDRRAAVSVDHAVGWLKSAKRPFFFWLHLYDPHSPYDPPEPFKTQFQDRPYDGEIAYADRELGRLLDWMKQAGLYDRSLIIFLSDHGESLGEHGEREHGFYLYHSTTHIPLIVKLPHAVSAPAAGAHAVAADAMPSDPRLGRALQVGDPVETVAIAPTILAVAGLHDPISAQFAGRALPGTAGRSIADDPDSFAYSETFYPFSSFGWSPLHALEQGRYRYVEAPQPELYDVVEDPQQTHNIVQKQAAVVAVLHARLQALLKQNPFRPAPSSSASGAAPALSADAADKLRALGYVAYRSPVPIKNLAALADPKTKLWEFNSILRAADAFQVRDFSTGEDLLHEVAEKDPEMYLVSFMLGEAALRQSHWEQAAASLQRCLVLNPNFDQAMTALARALQALKQPEAASEWLHKAIALNPQNFRAWYALAGIEGQAASGSASATTSSVTSAASAVAAYEKVLAIQPNFALADRDLGMLLFHQKDYATAAPHLHRAIAAGLQDAYLHNFLGICYSRTNHLGDAISNYREALRLDPKLAEAHLNLAFALERTGKSAESQAEYAQACSLDTHFCRQP